MNHKKDKKKHTAILELLSKIGKKKSEIESRKPDPSAALLDSVAVARQDYARGTATEEQIRLIHGPPKPKEFDPSAAWIDSVAVSKERIAQGTDTEVDRRRAAGYKEPLSEEQKHRRYILARKERISKGIATKEDSTRVRNEASFSNFEDSLKPGSDRPKNESMADRLERYNDEVNKQSKKIFDAQDEGLPWEGYKPKEAAYQDSLNMTMAFSELGYPTFQAGIEAHTNAQMLLQEAHRITKTHGKAAANRFLDEHGTSFWYLTNMLKYVFKRRTPEEEEK